MSPFPKLAGLAEVAGLAGVTRKRAWQLTRHPQFPKPVQVLAMGPVWRETDVRKFLDTPRPSGRQHRTYKLLPEFSAPVVTSEAE